MDMSLAVEHQTGFALDLHKQVAKQNETVLDKGNSLMSPISIATVIAMAGVGAKGKTLEEIQTVLKLPQGEAMHQNTSQLKTAIFKDGSHVGGPLLSFANGLWVDKSSTLKPAFHDTVKEYYGTEASAADFGAKAEEERTTINKWVSDETRGKIEDLLPPNSVNERTAMVLANVLYFKGTWKKQFNPEETKNDDFHLLDGTTVSVPYMTSTQKQLIRRVKDHKVLEVPYVQGDDNRSFSMFFILPDRKDGIVELEKGLDAKTLTTYLEGTGWELKVGELRLPKFKISVKFEATDVLGALGLKVAFSPGADFSDMVEGSSVYLSNVFHQCFIEVNEEGTEATAATAATWQMMSYTVPVDFVADHLFLFVLKENVTGLILFLGRITNPSLSQ